MTPHVLDQAFQPRLARFYPLAKVKQTCIELEELFKDLKKDEDNITKLILIKLYETSMETIKKLDDKNTCPVCDKVFAGNLEKHVEEKHKVLEDLANKKKDYTDKRDTIDRRLKQVIDKVVAIEDEDGKKVLETFESFFVDIKKLESKLPNVRDILEKPLQDMKVLFLSSLEEIIKIDNISDKETEFKKIVTDKIILLSEDKKSKNLADDFEKIITLINLFTIHIKYEKQISYLSEIIRDLDTLFSELTKHIQKRIQDTFSIIKEDVIECYNILESSNEFLKNPNIILMEGRDKAIEIEIEFANNKVSPAYKFMSESQVNSFGLAIFLSAVKHFNNEFKFIILDDVVNSFDTFKRPKIGQLLASKFSDFQILLLTHDLIFFETIQKKFPQWSRYKFTGWDYSTGPKTILAKDFIEEIQRSIDEDNPLSAGQMLGRYLEVTLSDLNQNLSTQMDYRVGNNYTLSEFYNGFASRMKDKVKIPNKKHKVLEMLKDFEESTIFRNYCVHYKEAATQYTSPEIKLILDKWLAIEKEVYCNLCRSYPEFKKNDGVEYVKCNCSSLDLKDASKFAFT